MYPHAITASTDTTGFAFCFETENNIPLHFLPVRTDLYINTKGCDLHLLKTNGLCMKHVAASGVKFRNGYGVVYLRLVMALSATVLKTNQANYRVLLYQ